MSILSSLWWGIQQELSLGPRLKEMERKAERFAQMTTINGQPPLVDMSSDSDDDNRPRYSTRRMRQEIERARQQERERCAEHCIKVGYPDIAHDLRNLK